MPGFRTKAFRALLKAVTLTPNETRIPAKTARYPESSAAPPTLPDRKDAGSAARVALGSCGRSKQPQRKPRPNQPARKASAPDAERGAFGWRE